MLIGITGQIGSGKTTASRYLCNHWSFKEYMMAQPLKDIAKIFGFNDSQLYGTQAQKLKTHPQWGISAREFLQKVGTDIFRDKLPEAIPDMKIEKSIWCDLFKLKYDKGVSTVVSDIRFLDEAQTIKELGGIIIRIERENLDSYTHRSEIEMQQIKPDFSVNNNGNIQHLYEELDKILINKLGAF